MLHRYGIVSYFLYLVQFRTTGLHSASGTFHPYPAAALYNSVNQSYMLHLFWQIFQSLPPSSCNLLMFSLPLLSSIPRSRLMGTPLQYMQIHRKTLFLTDSFFPLSMKNVLERNAPGHLYIAYNNYRFSRDYCNKESTPCVDWFACASID